MEKEFIYYEQSLDLKKLGFDEPCWGYFTPLKHWQIKDYKGDPSPWLKYDVGDHMYLKTVSNPFGDNLHRKETFIKNSSFKKAIKNISAPLYRQAFRWFKEKYGLMSCITPCSDGEYIFTLYDLNKCDLEVFVEDIEIMESEDSYEFFEEAELECLKKLIEIVKLSHKTATL